MQEGRREREEIAPWGRTLATRDLWSDVCDGPAEGAVEPSGAVPPPGEVEIEEDRARPRVVDRDVRRAEIGVDHEQRAARVGRLVERRERAECRADCALDPRRIERAAGACKALREGGERDALDPMPRSLRILTALEQARGDSEARQAREKRRLGAEARDRLGHPSFAGAEAFLDVVFGVLDRHGRPRET